MLARVRGPLLFLFVIACSAAGAQALDPSSPLALQRPDVPGARGVIGVPFFEGFEPPAWSSGPIGQNGWSTTAANTFPAVMSDNPAAGQQHVRFDDDPQEGPGFPGNLTFSPTFVGPRPTLSIELDVFVSNLGGADYYINPQAPTRNLTCARVRFAGRDPNGDGRRGDIQVLDDLNGPAPGGIMLVDTGAVTLPGKYRSLRIEYAGDALVRYYYDGKLIHTGSAIYDAAGEPCNGPQVEELALADNQFQFLAAGNFADIDNVRVTPEPGTILLLLAGRIVVARRQRGSRLR